MDISIWRKRKANTIEREDDLEDEKCIILFSKNGAVTNLTVLEQKPLTEYFSDNTNKMKFITWIVTGEESDDYIREIMRRGDSKTFNSGFSWTYKNTIQLKGLVI